MLSSGRFRLSPATGNTIRQSSSFVLLYARHLFPFGRRLLSLCALQETWLFLATTALNHARFLHPTMPPWHADVIGAGWRSQTKGESRKRTEESLLSSGRFRLSPATEAGRQVARATPCFHPIDFHITTQPSLVLSWAPRKYRTLSSPLVPHPPANLGCLLPRIAVT